MKHVAAILLLVLSSLGGPAFAGGDATPEAAPKADAAKADVAAECKGCETGKTYDSVKVIRTVKDVDRSRVINTTTVVPIYRRPVERIPVVTVVNFVVHRYRVVEMPLSYSYRPVFYGHACHVRHRIHRAPSCGGPLRVRG